MKAVQRTFKPDLFRRPPPVDFSTCISLTEVLRILTARSHDMVESDGRSVNMSELTSAVAEAFHTLVDDRKKSALLNRDRTLPKLGTEHIDRTLAEYGITREYGLRSTVARLVNSEDAIGQLTVDIRAQFHLD